MKGESVKILGLRKDRKSLLVRELSSFQAPKMLLFDAGNLAVRPMHQITRMGAEDWVVYPFKTIQTTVVQYIY